MRPSSTQSKDRKRMLRLLIKDITVEKPANRKQLLVHIRWQGGACSDVSVQLPPNIADRPVPAPWGEAGTGIGPEISRGSV